MDSPAAFVSQEEQLNIIKESLSDGTEITTLRSLGSSNEVYLYKSNHTYKLVDNNNQPLYEERYLEAYTLSGCYFLISEDNKCIVVNSNGDKLETHDMFSYSDEKIYFENQEINTDNLLSDGRNICILISTEDSINLYYFN